jgi:hypothetical protein
VRANNAMQRECSKGETNEGVEDNNVEEDYSCDKECRRLVKGVIRGRLISLLGDYPQTAQGDDVGLAARCRAMY